MQKDILIPDELIDKLVSDSETIYSAFALPNYVPQGPFKSDFVFHVKVVAESDYALDFNSVANGLYLIPVLNFVYPNDREAIDIAIKRMKGLAPCLERFATRAMIPTTDSKKRFKAENGLSLDLFDASRTATGLRILRSNNLYSASYSYFENMGNWWGKAKPEIDELTARLG